MKYLSNISRIHNCSNQSGIKYVASDIFLCHFFPCSQQLKITKLTTKILDPQNTHEKKLCSHEIPARKNFGPTKYPQRHDGTMVLDPRDPR